MEDNVYDKICEIEHSLYEIIMKGDIAGVEDLQHVWALLYGWEKKYNSLSEN